MKYDIKMCDGYLRAEMVDRETGEETREFLQATFRALRAHKAKKCSGPKNKQSHGLPTERRI